MEKYLKQKKKILKIIKTSDLLQVMIIRAVICIWFNLPTTFSILKKKCLYIYFLLWKKLQLWGVITLSIIALVCN